MASKLMDFVYDQFPDAKPQNSNVEITRSFFETLYAVSAPPEAQRKLLVLFPGLGN